MQKKRIDTNFFPGWTRKSLTFTIDDGNIKYDRRFIDIMEPAGIRGTFNLCHTASLTPEEYRTFYDGFEIANHCKHHPRVFADGYTYEVSDEPFDPLHSRSYTEGEPVVYKWEVEGIYKIHPYPEIEKPDGWYLIATTEKYIECIDETREELRAVFGDNAARGFVWPSAKQNNERVREHLISRGYYGIRKTGHLMGRDNFRLPTDRTDWTYTAREDAFLEAMELYESYPDDGELKFFCLGLHAADYERAKKWDDLQRFADKYGSRPDDYYYATNAEIFDYEDAIRSLVITEEKIENPSDICLYIKVNGERVRLLPRSQIKIKG